MDPDKYYWWGNAYFDPEKELLRPFYEENENNTTLYEEEGSLFDPIE